MDLVVKPSLKLMSLQKIATELWTRHDVVTPKENSEMREFMLKLEAKVMEKVRALILPPAFKKEVEYLVKIIGAQMLEWFTYLLVYYDITKINLKGIRWSSSGTIDKVKNVEILMADLSLDPKARFQLACDFGFQEQIQALSAKTPPDEDEIRGNNNFVYRYIKSEQKKLSKFWRYRVNGEEDELPDLIRSDIDLSETPSVSTFLYLFKHALENYNKVALKYYYAKLTHEETEWVFAFVRKYLEFFVITFRSTQVPQEFLAEILYFLLSRMSEKQIVELLSEDPNPEQLFSALLVWPYHDSFLTNIEQKWEFFSGHGFQFLLIKILNKINHAGEDCVFRDIFRELWRSSPERLKKCVIGGPNGLWFWLYRLFRDGEDGLCRMMLKSGGGRDTDRMLLDPSTQKTFAEYQKMPKKWKFVAFFIVECGSSRKAIDQYKQLLINNNVSQNDDEETNEFFMFLDNFNSESK